MPSGLMEQASKGPATPESKRGSPKVIFSLMAVAFRSGYRLLRRF